MQELAKIELLASEMISSEEIESKTMSPYIAVDHDHKGLDDEWTEVELENSDEQKKTFYQVNNNENDSDEEVENVTYDLTNDIAINQMLADQGASYNPDAEFFDITQYHPEGDVSTSSQEQKQKEQESYDYSPYPHQTTSDKRTSIIK